MQILRNTQYLGAIGTSYITDAQYFRGMDANMEQIEVSSGVDTAYIKQYAVYSRGRYCYILGDEQYFRLVEHSNAEQYAVIV